MTLYGSLCELSISFVEEFAFVGALGAFERTTEVKSDKLVTFLVGAVAFVETLEVLKTVFDLDELSVSFVGGFAFDDEAEIHKEELLDPTEGKT